MATKEKVQSEFVGEFVVRNYNAICKVCSTFLSNTRPDLYDREIDHFVNHCFDYMLKVAHKYDPKKGAETTYVYNCVENQCKTILQKRQRLEKKHLSNAQIYGNTKEIDYEKDEDELEEPVLIEENPTSLQAFVYATLKRNGVKIQPLVRTYVAFMLHANKHNMKDLWRKRYETGKDKMSYKTFTNRVGKIRSTLLADEYFIEILQERSKKGGIIRL